MADLVSKVSLFHINKVLPLVYDDALSYYEVLEKNVAKLNEVIEALNGLDAKVLDETKAYIAEVNAQLIKEFNDLSNSVDNRINSFTSGITNDFDEFTRSTDNKITIINNRVTHATALFESYLAQSEAYTNQAILNNNDYIIEQTTKALSGITVLNYFTGERVSIQAMFDYLAQFHLENAITVNQLVSRRKTVNELIALNMTLTQLATNGGTIIQ